MRRKHLSLVVSVAMSVAAFGAMSVGIAGSGATAGADDLGVCAVGNAGNGPTVQDGCGPFNFEISPTSGPIGTEVTVNNLVGFGCDQGADTVTIRVYGIGDGEDVLLFTLTVPVSGAGNWIAQFLVPVSAYRYSALRVTAECNDNVGPGAIQAAAVVGPAYAPVIFTITAIPNFTFGVPNAGPRSTDGIRFPTLPTPARLPQAPVAAPLTAGARFTG